MRFLGSKYAKNAFAAGARTPLGELTVLPDPPSWIWGLLRGGEARGGPPDTVYSR